MQNTKPQTLNPVGSAGKDKKRCDVQRHQDTLVERLSRCDLGLFHLPGGVTASHHALMLWTQAADRLDQLAYAEFHRFEHWAPVSIMARHKFCPNNMG
jgi:hypothetical protein